MNYTNLPILLVLGLSVLGNNVTVAIAALVLLLINLLGLNAWFQPIEKFGISGGVTLLTMAVLVPLVTGRIGAPDLLRVFKSPAGILAVVIGISVAWIAAQGVPYMKSSPETVTALMVGTLIGVCFFKGLAVGPLIAGGMVALLVGAMRI